MELIIEIVISRIQIRENSKSTQSKMSINQAAEADRILPVLDDFQTNNITVINKKILEDLSRSIFIEMKKVRSR